jgi:hypothetical protein
VLTQQTGIDVRDPRLWNLISYLEETLTRLATAHGDDLKSDEDDHELVTIISAHTDWSPYAFHEAVQTLEVLISEYKQLIHEPPTRVEDQNKVLTQAVVLNLHETRLHNLLILMAAILNWQASISARLGLDVLAEMVYDFAQRLLDDASLQLTAQSGEYTLLASALEAYQNRLAREEPLSDRDWLDLNDKLSSLAVRAR